MNKPFPKHKIFIFLIFTLSFGFVSCNGENPALDTTWSLTKLVSVGVPIEDSVTETVEVKNCGIPIEKTTDCSAGTSSDLTVSANGGGAFGAGAQLTFDAGVGATLGIGKESGQSVKLETPSDSFIYKYTVIKNYQVINGEAIALSSNQEEKIVNYSFHASCSIDIISKEQTSCPGNNLIPTQTSLPSPLTFKITVPADVEWFDTGIEIKIGQTIQFSASGNINLKGGLAEGNSPTPDGQVNKTCHPWVEVNIGDCLINDESAGVLVSKIGTGNAFRIGKSSEIVSVEEGILFLAVNDNIGYFQDNSGVYNVKVTIR